MSTSLGTANAGARPGRSRAAATTAGASWANPVLAQKLPMLCNNKRQILPAAKRYCDLIGYPIFLQIVGHADRGSSQHGALFRLSPLRPASCKALSVTLSILSPPASGETDLVAPRTKCRPLRDVSHVRQSLI